MKSASGVYLNIYSEWEKDMCDNDAISMKIDVFIIFPEYMGNGVNIGAADEIAQSTIKGFTSSTEDTNDLAVLKEKLENALIDFETQVIIEKLL